MIRKFKSMLAALVLSALALPAAAADPLAKDVFGAFRQSTGGPAGAFGGYSKGCATGNIQLPETGPTWQAMRLVLERPEQFGQMITHRFALTEANEALQVMAQRDALKAVLVP